MPSRAAGLSQAHTEAMHSMAAYMQRTFQAVTGKEINKALATYEDTVKTGDWEACNLAVSAHILCMLHASSCFHLQHLPSTGKCVSIICELAQYA